MTPFHLRRRIRRLLAESDEQAIAHCRELVRKSRSNFSYAFVFLPPDQRAAVEAVYAFCRLADDAVDEGTSPEEAAATLDEWRRELYRAFGRGDGPPTTPVGQRLLHTARRFSIRFEDLELVLDGIAMDLERRRYATWQELREYCRHVAGAVGLICIRIFGCSDERSADYAIELGTALQLTNILRDVAEDAERGRIYLPLEDLARFGVAERDLLARHSSSALRALIDFEAHRARTFFRRADALLTEPERSKLFVAELMGDIYEALLDEIERHDCEVLDAPPHLRRRRKLALAVRCWIEHQLAA